MKCNITLRHFIALTFLLTIHSALYSQNTYVSNGGSDYYALANGDSLYIRSGVYTGYIGQFDPGARITVAAGATFQPSGINNARGTIRVAGTANFTNWFGTNGGFNLYNYGSVNFMQGAQTNEGPQNWINYFGATMKFQYGFRTNNTVFENRGTIISMGEIYISGESFTNRNTTEINGAFTINGAAFNNGGKLKATGLTSFTGNINFTNNCRLSLEGGFNNYSGTPIYNSGMLWLVANNNSKFTNTGTFINTPAGIVKAVNFVNSGTIGGSGYWYLTGTTENTGTIGVYGNTTDSIRIYDGTRTNPATIFDVQYGNVYGNAVYRTLSAPDTVNILSTCSPEVSSNILLPVKWEYFYVNLSNNIPALTWAAQQDPGTIFTVQRSYDAVNFSAVSTLVSTENKKEYRFEDKLVNTQVKAVYYRIQATEPTGAIRYSDTRTLTFNNTTGSTVQASPNPFTSQLNLNYQSPVTEKISIRVVSIAGNIMVNRTVTVGKGYNSIALTEAGFLIKGIYLVQLISDNKVIASERVIKQ